MSIDAGGHLQGGRYSILKKLGEAGKGIVFKARDTALNRVVAIKVLKSVALTGEAYSRFISEAQATAKLNHPNIVTIYNIGREGEQQFFVIEFIDGMSLRTDNPSLLVESNYARFRDQRLKIIYEKCAEIVNRNRQQWHRSSGCDYHLALKDLFNCRSCRAVHSRCNL